MATPNYTPAEFRSILNGWGHRTRTIADGPDFPISVDNSPLTDALTVEAIKKFQREYQLDDDGIVGPNTRNMAAKVVSNLQLELNSCANANLPSNQPFYGPLTTETVKKFQRKINVPQDGVANRSLRVNLYNLFKSGACPV
jgi:murein L,D-transpeptidase YcbB/YkuD